MAMKKKAFLAKRAALISAVDQHRAAAAELGFAKRAHDLGLDEADYNQLRKIAGSRK